MVWSAETDELHLEEELASMSHNKTVKEFINVLALEILKHAVFAEAEQTKGRTDDTRALPPLPPLHLHRSAIG